ncbi:MAG TPA: sigma-70 family RNA polymerase sigma factor [Opitutaceae bacterium]|nr:sigma-70 family RNA polymerase sigma factor [Opitutaceae bacterium]
MQSLSRSAHVIDPAALFTAHRERVRRSLARLVGDAEADDLTQETFMRVTRALPEFRGEANVTTWMLRIARGVGLDHLRSRRHNEARRTISLTVPTEESAPNESATPEPHEEATAPRRLVRTEMSACVREYVARLAPEHRVVIELRDLEGLSNSEIAVRFGVSVGNAKIRLHRARQALRRELERGCEFYHTKENVLSCDRRNPSSVAGSSVSSATTISSKEVRPTVRARRAKPTGRNNTLQNTSMNIPSNCGCAAPAPANACATSPVAFSPVAAEYVALGAAIGANCEPCLRYHVNEALKVGISAADIAKAVALAARVKETPARNILKLAERLLQPGGESGAASAPAATGCGCSAS